MRDYALHQAQVAGNIAGTGIVEKLLRNWLARRAVRRLQDLDDHLLRDIGARREDIRWAASLPLNTNAALALQERQMEQMTKASRHAV